MIILNGSAGVKGWMTFPSPSFECFYVTASSAFFVADIIACLSWEWAFKCWGSSEIHVQQCTFGTFYTFMSDKQLDFSVLLSAYFVKSKFLGTSTLPVHDVTISWAGKKGHWPKLLQLGNWPLRVNSAVEKLTRQDCSYRKSTSSQGLRALHKVRDGLILIISGWQVGDKWRAEGWECPDKGHDGGMGGGMAESWQTERDDSDEGMEGSGHSHS